MFRRGHLFMLFAVCGLCFVMMWRFGLFDKSVPVPTKNTNSLVTLQNINDALENSISSVQTQSKPPEPVKVAEPVKPVTPVKSIKSTKPAVRTPKPALPTKPAVRTPKPTLPPLSGEPQDSFYGKGCKQNRYRERLQKILNHWSKMAKRLDITEYFICFGSFLGSIRNGDIVPYDSDMDVCMFRRDYHKLYPEESKRPVNLNDGKFHMLLQRHAPHPKSNTPRKNCKGNLVRSVTDHCAILDPHGRLYLGALIWLDIFLIEDHGNELWDEYRDQIHPRDSILPTKPCKFLGIEMKCPNNAEKYLNVYYGKEYMKPHHVCKGGRWVQNMPGARRPFV